MLELNYALLREKLAELVDIEGVKPAHITAESGVHNIKKIIDGATTPTPNSWWRLHKAYPRTIPEPQYRSGDKIYVSADRNSHASGRDMTVTNHLQQNQLSVEEQFLINLLREKDPTKKDLRRYIQEQLAKGE